MSLDLNEVSPNNRHMGLLLQLFFLYPVLIFLVRGLLTGITLMGIPHLGICQYFLQLLLYLLSEKKYLPNHYLAQS